MKLHTISPFLTLCIFLLTVISDTEGSVIQNDELDIYSFLSSTRECLHGHFILCLKEKTLSYGESLRKRREIPLTSGFSLVDGDASPLRLSRPLPIDPVEREAEIDTRIYDIAGDFVTKYKVQYEENFGNKVEEGRKKKKIKKILPILELFRTVNSAIIVLFLSLITKLAIKLGLLIKLVTVIGGILLVKKYLSSHNQGETFEFPPGSHSEHPTSYSGPPNISGSHHDDHRGYLPPSGHDSSNDAQKLAYGAYGEGTKHGDRH